MVREGLVERGHTFVIQPAKSITGGREGKEGGREGRREGGREGREGGREGGACACMKHYITCVHTHTHTHSDTHTQRLHLGGQRGKFAPLNRALLPWNFTVKLLP